MDRQKKGVWAIVAAILVIAVPLTLAFTGCIGNEGGNEAEPSTPEGGGNPGGNTTNETGTEEVSGPKSIKLKADSKEVGIPSANLDENVSKTVTITVTAYDSNNNTLKDVVITVESKGASVTPSGISKKTGDNGTVKFQLTVELPAGVVTGEIKFTGSKTGYNDTEITVLVYRTEPELAIGVTKEVSGDYYILKVSFVQGSGEINNSVLQVKRSGSVIIRDDFSQATINDNETYYVEYVGPSGIITIIDNDKDGYITPGDSIKVDKTEVQTVDILEIKIGSNVTKITEI